MLKNYEIDNISLKNSLEWQNKILRWYQINKKTTSMEKRKVPKFLLCMASSEIIQQTGVKTAIPYFYKFIRKWPTLNSFSKASLDEIMFNWQGLGTIKEQKTCLRQLI